MRLGLQGRVALVTGGGRDVGGAISRALAAEGATVAVNYRSSQAEAEAVVASITAAGGAARGYRADVADYAAVKAMVDAIVRDYGRLDIVINNAGYVVRENFVDTKPASWAPQIDVGLYGPIHTCHAAVPHMIAQKHGRIVSFAGDSSRVGETGLAIGGAARAGAIALMKSLAKELGRYNITANAISLGLVESSHTDPKWMEQYRDRVTKMYPVRRLGKPEDVAPMVALLAADESGWITGQVVSVNGGFSMV
jgi:NAD(P)-dependent dehydrogenase (short-subunit alcohol dehydrogenase family)